MQITRVDLPTRDVHSAAAFFRDVLALAPSDDHTFTIGRTTVVLVERDIPLASQHLAFDIPRSQFWAAKQWLAQRVELLERDGRDDFESSPSWNARSLYFRGPDGTVLEFIARDNIPDDTAEEFGAGLIRSVSEIGLATSDVPGLAAELVKTLGIEHFGEGGVEFAPLGTEHGLVILVKKGRPWFPTTGAVAHSGPSAFVEAPRAGLVSSDGWRVQASPRGEGTADRSEIAIAVPSTVC